MSKVASVETTDGTVIVDDMREDVENYSYAAVSLKLRDGKRRHVVIGLHRETGNLVTVPGSHKSKALAEAFAEGMNYAVSNFPFEV